LSFDCPGSVAVGESGVARHETRVASHELRSRGLQSKGGRHETTDAERAELKAAFGPRQDRITAWLDTFKPGTMTDEAAAFMYAQLAIEEMP
jgi:hypothetical protein